NEDAFRKPARDGAWDLVIFDRCSPAKEAGVTMFTRLSVHWADRITATSNSYVLLKSSSVSALGRAF
ncbi:MAG TPA: hypothetical protein VFT06_09235, partial [Flavisolibacter sp.]|nr:hypothetical protein [Flavisolibacter sp.]